MDEAQARAEWEAKLQDPEFMRRGQEQGKLALSLGKMTTTYADAFNGRDYAYLPVVVLARVSLNAEHDARPEAVEVVAHPTMPTHIVHALLSTVVQTLATIPDGDFDVERQVMVKVADAPGGGYEQ